MLTQSGIQEILAIGARFSQMEMAHQFIAQGKSVDEMRAAILEKVNNARQILTNSDIGLTDREARRFSFARAIMAMAQRDMSLAPFERECSEAVAKLTRRTPHGIFVPHEVVTRDLTKGTAVDGGHTVATNLLASSFIDLLRNLSLVRRMGATVLGGLVGDVVIPRQTGGATAYWVAENTAPSESQQTFDQVAMNPKTVGAFTDISRKLLIQSSIDVEAFVRKDLATILAVEIDRAAINGSGASNQPRGILNVTGIGDVAGGTNGAAPTWANIMQLWKEIAIDNAAFGTLGYLTNAAVIAKLATTEKAANTAQFVAPSLPDQNGFAALGGLRAGVSNQVPSNLTKGTSSGICSAILFGNWADLIIGEWAGLDLLVDPYTGGAAGTVRVRVLQDVDIAVRHPESFSAMKDALTS